MANIVINDLLDSRELDRKAMAALLGGCGGFGGGFSPWAQRFMGFTSPPRGFAGGPASGNSGFGGGFSQGNPFPGPGGGSGFMQRGLNLSETLTVSFSFSRQLSAFQRFGPSGFNYVSGGG